jgi:hypothetical protein
VTERIAAISSTGSIVVSPVTRTKTKRARRTP